jgi:hypothetical protein
MTPWPAPRSSVRSDRPGEQASASPAAVPVVVERRQRAPGLPDRARRWLAEEGAAMGVVAEPPIPACREQ